MYDFNFYFWSYVIVGILGFFGMLFIGLIAFVTRPRKRIKKISIQELNAKILALEDEANALRLYDLFLERFSLLPNSPKAQAKWLECVQNLSRCSLIHLDKIMALRQKLERVNEKHQEKIKNTIASALKNRNERKKKWII